MAAHYKAAREAGANEAEIREAVEIGEKVKEAVTTNTWTFAHTHIPELNTAKEMKQDSCNDSGCG